MQEEAIKSIENQVEKIISQIDFRMHTIIIMVGPSGCGKTYFTENKLIPELNAHGDVNIHHIASDDIRRELLGDMSISKMDNRMLHVSKPAFDILNAKVNALTSYPVNSDFIIVDSTGLSDSFRKEIKQIADDNNYNLAVIMFDYKGRAPYYEFLTENEESKAITSRQLDYMRKQAMKDMSKKVYKDIYKIKSHDLDNYKVNITNYDRYQECVLPSGDYVTIGDIHGCYEEFYALLEKNGFEINDGKITHEDNKKIALVGDLVDKGYNVRWVIELVHNNLDIIFMVKGNHENFVYKYLKNLDGDEDSGLRTKDLPTQDVIDTYFDSIELFRDDQELKQKFYEVVDAMKPFLKGDNFIVTHAPCDMKYLGKLGSKSERNQRTIQYPKMSDKNSEGELLYKSLQDYLAGKSNYFKFFRDQASKSYPYHLFGHVSTRGIGQKYNKINLDSGCVAGGSLSSIIVNDNGRHFIKKVSSFHNDNIIKTKELTEFFYTPPKKVSLDDLEGRERGRIFYAAEAKVNFVSGTICPADKLVSREEAPEGSKGKISLDNSELESLDEGMKYFLKKGVNMVMAQAKYMGSRANVYLHKSKKKTFTTSRGGFIIKPENIDLTEAYKKLYKIPFIKEAFKTGTELLILDAELLPWSALGRGLIDSNFVTVDNAISSEVDFLKENGFEDALNAVYEGPYKDCEFERIQHKASREEVIKQVGSNNERTFRSIREFMGEFSGIDNLSELTKVYSRQIELYGSDGEPYFKPFSILKQVFKDGAEKLFFDESNEDIYKSINTDDYIVADLNNEDDVAALRAFYEKTTTIDEMEGIMLKPLTVYVKGVAPGIKVRNPKYLTIVYGPDYQAESKLMKLMERKGIFNKLKISVKEWEVGKRLLEIPQSQISKDNEHYVQAYAEMILEEKKEHELDPRL